MTRVFARALAIGFAAAALGCGDSNPTAPGVVGTSQASLSRGPLLHVEGGIADLSGRCPAIRFVIGSFHIATNSVTLFQRGSCGRLANGSDVDVSGFRQADGSVLAVEVELRGR